MRGNISHIKLFSNEIKAYRNFFCELLKNWAEKNEKRINWNGQEKLNLKCYNLNFHHSKNTT